MPAAEDMDPESLLPRLRNHPAQPRQQGSRSRTSSTSAATTAICTSCRRNSKVDDYPGTDRTPARRDHAAGRDPGQVRRADPGRTRRRACAASRPRPRSPWRSSSRRRNWARSWSSKKMVQPEMVEAAAAKQKQVADKKSRRSAPDPRPGRQARPADRPGRRTGHRRRLGQPAGPEERPGRPGRSHLGALAPGREHPRFRPATAHGADRRNLQPLPPRGARRLARNWARTSNWSSAAPRPSSTSRWSRRSATR